MHPVVTVYMMRPTPEMGFDVPKTLSRRMARGVDGHDGRCDGSRNGRPLYFDDDHLSEFGNKLLVPMFAAVFGG